MLQNEKSKHLAELVKQTYGPHTAAYKFACEVLQTIKNEEQERNLRIARFARSNHFGSSYSSQYGEYIGYLRSR